MHVCLGLAHAHFSLSTALPLDFNQSTIAGDSSSLDKSFGLTQILLDGWGGGKLSHAKQ